MPIIVWKKIRRIQREFLWGGKGGVKKINWVKWDTICKPKHLGGLGVRDARVVNISLLSKWRWRLLSEDNSMWQKVIKRKYGELACGTVVIGEECKPWFSSNWWRDICSIGRNLDSDWFHQQVVKRIGDGRHTRFWRDPWLGDFSIMNRFPRLYSISTQQEVTVAALWNSTGSVGWVLNWRRRLFEWEQELLDELRLLLNQVSLSQEGDRWVWKPGDGGLFSVKSTFLLVSKLMDTGDVINPEAMSAFKVIWKCSAPSKVSALVWKVLHDRIPTKRNLVNRGVNQLEGSLSCSFCGLVVENSLHLLLYCDFSLSVWSGIFAWLGLFFQLPHDFKSLLNYAAVVTGRKQVNQALVMVWAAVFWVIWYHRNQIVFENGRLDAALVIDRIKTVSWKWWMSRSKGKPCLLYEWLSEPMICMAM
jgi:hypothetical protein